MKPSWDDIQYALAVARNGSTLGAARELDVNQTTVARRIDQLELALACRLFDRRRAGYQLTEAGRATLSSLEAIEREVENLMAQLPSQQRRTVGRLRITAGATMAQWVLIPVLESLRPQFKTVAWELVVSETNFDVAGGEADVAIRACQPPPDGTLILRRLPSLNGLPRQWLVFQEARRNDPELRALIEAMLARLDALRAAA